MDKAHPPLKKGETISDIREKPGASNVGKYGTNEIFCGTTKGTFPITENGKISVKRLRNALARAHFDPNPEKVRACVLRYGRQYLQTYKESGGS